MMKKILLFYSILMMLVLVVENVEAQQQKGTRKQTLSFEDELVEGASQKPELFYLLQKKNFNYKKLIRLREDFLPEMRKTGEDVHQAGSGD